MPDPTEAEIRERWVVAAPSLQSLVRAEVVVTARADVAWLLAELERVREDLEHVRADRDQLLWLAGQ